MVSIIAAIGKNRELGKDNRLLWHIKADMEHFKRLTLNRVVVMGRKTFDSLPQKFKPLPHRINVVITRDKNWQFENVLVFNSLENAIEELKNKHQEIFIIGGASIYQQALNFADKLYLTIIEKTYPDADVYFPPYAHLFKKIIHEEEHEENGIRFKFMEMIR